MTTRASSKLPATCSNERASPSSASPPTARKPYGAPPTRAAGESSATCTRARRASVVHVEVDARDGALEVSVSDDGVGGTDPRRGSGIVGLQDRIDVLGAPRVAARRSA
jgi:hypothetical protein